jgi:transposase
MNQLQALAMNEGYRWKKKLFSEQGRTQLEKLALAPWASRRRKELLELLDRMNPTIAELTAAVEREARKRPEVLRLMTHPGVGPLTALAFVLIIGTPTRFERGKQIGTYVGMIPCEDSSAGKQRLGHAVRPAVPVVCGDGDGRGGMESRGVQQGWTRSHSKNGRASSC